MILPLFSPALSLTLIFFGHQKKLINYILVALCLSFLSVLFLYIAAGSEILGSYFDYRTAILYTVNLAFALLSLLYLTYCAPKFAHFYVKVVSGILTIGIIVGAVILLTNVWLNAFFIEHRALGTPIMQVSTFEPPEYCNYKYVFYKVNLNQKVSYMCPNHYWVFPSMGDLAETPSFLNGQMAAHLRLDKSLR